MIFDSGYIVLMVITVAIGGLTQFYVTSTYRRYSQVSLATGLTGAEVARAMLDRAGLHHVGVEMVHGELTDHFDPRDNVLRLSQGVYAGRTVAAAGVASHEAGHAVQHARGYVPAKLRGSLVPAANIGSQAGPILIIAGVFIGLSGLSLLGVLFYAGAVLFQIVTLPVEFDASRRAVASLAETGALPSEQVSGARSVLTAAAFTYLGAALISVLSLLYYLGLASRDE